MTATTGMTSTSFPRSVYADDGFRVDPPEPNGPCWLLAPAILPAVIAAVPFMVLGSVFDFPGILREPADVVLAKFSENPTTFRWAYYTFMLSSLVLVPIAVILGRVLGTGGRP